MRTREDIESFLDRLGADGARITEAEPGTWIVTPGDTLDYDVVVHLTPPVLLLRVKVMDLPDDDASKHALAMRLLQLNATDLVHGSYGVNGGAIVLTEALELAHLDYDEFLAAYDAMTIALASHLREFASFREAR